MSRIKARVGTWRNASPCVTEVIDIMPNTQQQQQVGDSSSDNVVFFVPGNPAILVYYEQFLNGLHERLRGNYRIIAVNHLGHHSYTSHKEINHHHQFFGLEDQIQHKISIIDEILKENPKTRFLFMGHSIGAYIIMHALIKRPDLQNALTGIYHLFPTLQSLNVAPLIRAISIPIARDVLCPVLAAIPDNTKNFFLSFSGEAKNESSYLVSAPEYFHSSTLKNILHLVRDELRLVREMRLEEVDFLLKHSKKSLFMFAEDDPYVSLDLAQDYMKNFPDSRFVNFSLKQNVKHAFVLSDIDLVIRELVNQIENENHISDDEKVNRRAISSSL